MIEKELDYKTYETMKNENLRAFINKNGGIVLMNPNNILVNINKTEDGCYSFIMNNFCYVYNKNAKIGYIYEELQNLISSINDIEDEVKIPDDIENEYKTWYKERHRGK